MRLFLFFLLSLLLVSNVCALGVRTVVNTPSWTIRSSEEQPLKVGDVVEAYVNVSNLNLFPVNILISSLNTNVSVIFVDTPEFVLSPNESRKVRYEALLKNNGSYYNTFAVKFDSMNDSNSPRSAISTALLKVIGVEGVNLADLSNEERNVADSFVVEKSFTNASQNRTNIVSEQLNDTTVFETSNESVSIVSFGVKNDSFFKKIYWVTLAGMIFIIITFYLLRYLLRYKQEGGEKNEENNSITDGDTNGAGGN